MNENSVLMLSSLTGADAVLKGAVSVNPFDTEGVARALKDALELPKTERAERAAQLRARVDDLDVHLWAKRFLNSLERA